MFQKHLKRESGIELLKIISIFIIVVAHLVQTLNTDCSKIIGTNDYIVHFQVASTSPNIISLAFLRHFGIFGNIIFFVCSIWFLQDKKTIASQRIIRLFFDTTIVGILFLLLAIPFWNKLGSEPIVRSIFPVFCANNWYITFYICFCLVSPFLNKLMDNINNKGHIVIIIAFVIASLVVDHSISQIFAFPAYYLIVGYFKRYLKSLCESTKFNIFLVVISLFLFIGLFLITELVAPKYHSSEIDVMWLNSHADYFFFFFGFGTLNLFRKLKFKNGFINYLSSLTLLVYLVHENIIFRQTIRPILWNVIYHNFGYSAVVGWAFVYALLLLIASFIVGALYSLTLQKPVHWLSDKTNELVLKIVNKIRKAKENSN